MEAVIRCAWVGDDPLYQAYHDHEWGVPVHEDHKLFEFLLLEGAQAGLSWRTILRKRPAYRVAFEDFDPLMVANFSPDRIESLMENPGIVRNRLKIKAAVSNARAFLEIQGEFGSFNHYLWRFVNGAPIRNSWRSIAEIPSQTTESQALSRDLRQRGFKFIGPTITYAYMQAVGLVNDHVVECFRYRQL